MGIALQIERLAAGSIAASANVIFDTTVFATGNITYDSVTGIITFNEAGRYAVSWWVAPQPCTNGVVFSLSFSQGDLRDGSSPVKTAEVSGIGIFKIIEAPVTASLVNASTAAANFSTTVPVKATLVVVQDEDVALVPTGLILPTIDTGLTGSTGDTGLIGPTSDARPAGAGAIIPFSSGDPIAVTTIALGLVGLPAFVGCGNSIQSPVILTPTIDISALTNYAFLAPRNGTITSFAALLSTTAALALVGSTVTVTAQIYSSTTPDNTFSPIAGVSVDFILTGIIAAGEVFNAIVTGLAVPIVAEDRLLLVVSATAAGKSLTNTVAGFLSAGLSIN